MLAIGPASDRNCAGVTRRDLLRVGAVTAAGLSLPDLFRRAEASREGPARNCIFLFLWGGPSQYETFDPKPDLPAAPRGPFAPIPTSVDGLRFCEHLPRLAQLARRFTTIRCMHHENAQHHESGSYSQAGRLPMAGARFPNQGSVVSRFAAAPGPLPSFIRLGPELWDCAGEVTGQDAGHLGGSYAPFVVSDPREPLERVAPVQPPAAVSPPRLDRRRALLDQLDTLRRVVESDPVAARDAAYRRAFAIVTTPAARQALDLNLEPPAARARYGETLPGQATLMARRLVEAGVRFVQVNWCRYVAQQGWDTHGTGDNMGGTLPQMRDYLLPTLDRVVGTLFEDLEERGLDRSTLVVVAGEFGRTYSINRTAGRDHWPGVYPALLFGAGIPRGLVIGASDSDGMYPDGLRCRPEDLTLTIYRLLGLDPARIRQAGLPAEAAGIPGIAAGAR